MKQRISLENLPHRSKSLSKSEMALILGGVPIQATCVNEGRECCTDIDCCWDLVCSKSTNTCAKY